MKYIYRVSALATFLISIALVTTGFGQDRGRKSDLSGSFRNYELANIAATTAESINGSRKTLRFTMKGELIEFDLAENDLRAPGYKAVDRGIAGDREIGSGPVNTFKGTVRGSDGSEVRISIRDSKVEGFFRYDGEQYFIEPAAKYSNDAPVGSSVIYKAEDSLGVEEFSCLADVPTRIKLGDSIVSNSGERSLESLRRFDVATEADLEWVNIFGSAAAANNEILAILNMVEGTYIAELSLRIRVTYQHTWTTPDPYASSSGSSGILLNFRNHWNANYQSALFPRNVAHLFTAKSNSLSQGVAYIGVVCQNGLASYGLTGYVSWVPGKYLVPAHELGHNLGAQHAEAAQSCGNTLMNAQLSGSTSLSFCSFSQSQINGYIATSGSCLLPATSKIYDFDGDNRADMAVFRPTEGNWYIRRSNGGYTFLQFGLSGDKPVSADYDGDGRMDAAVYRNGIWWRLKSATNTVDYVEFGLAGDIPVPAHFDTDGKADVAVYRPSSGEWYW
ncbi:MAG: M12 family metallo-peptidase, partial [Pyrinomonadaceae bacterium]